MVIVYSNLDLTKASDRLSAIESCAVQVRELLNDSYCYGLWSGGLAQDIAWNLSPASTTSQRPPELFNIPTRSWASVGVGVWYPYVEAPASPLSHLGLVTCQNDERLKHNHTLLHVTGQVLPGKIKLGGPAGSLQNWTPTGEKRGMYVQVCHKCLESGAEFISLSSPEYWFIYDFELESENWDCETWYDIGVVRLGEYPRYELYMVLWRYGRAILGSGLRREPDDGYPIYQRVRMLNFSRFGDSDLERRHPWVGAKQA